ncbi:MAG: ATP-binding cassette domain-containing protein, partial [Roseiflexaceae bacterium]
GHVKLLGNDLTGAKPRTILETGVAHIPEDRHRHGLVLSYPIADNLVLSTYYNEPFAHGIRVDAEAITQNAQHLVKEFDIRTPSILTPASSLSGGNQQKVVVAREFSRPIKLLIAAQPTRGLDVGSIEFIHNSIIRQRDEGVAVLVVSAELDEILALSDRIAVMFKGQIIAIVPAEEATREGLGLLMAGIVDEHARMPTGEEAHVHRA